MTLREKAEAVIDAANGVGKWGAACDVCEAYLAEHPDDDDEPPTDEWAAAIGIDDETIDAALQRVFSPNPPPPEGTPLLPTKRHVRAFCFALGIPNQTEA